MSAAIHHHTWFQLVTRFAQAMGTSDYRGDPLSFSLPGGPTIVAELLDDGHALGVTVDLRHTPDGDRLEAFLQANRIDNAQDAGVYAVMPSRNHTLLFFRRLEDAGAYAYEDMMAALQVFADTAQTALDALPEPLQSAPAAPSQDAAAFHAETFRHIWEDFALTQGLGSDRPEPEADGSRILLLDGKRHVFVRPDAARGRVVLTTSLALLPLFNEDEPAAWRGLLEAHTLGAATGGAVFAIDPELNELIAWRSLSLVDLDAYGLNDGIDSLAEVARFYTETLRLDMLAA